MAEGRAPERRAVVSPTAARRLGAHQMAFVRAWAEGVEPALAWQRYLGQGQAPEGRRVRAELQALLDLLRGVARAQGRPDLAALLRRDPEAMAEPADARPSLDEFRAQQPEDFYSEAELLELYQASHGATDARSGARRRQRLRARQLAALQWLEAAAVREPRPEDACSAWLDERLAARLAQAGILRLADLRQRLRARGYHWYRGLARVGPAAARRLVQWWQEHARTLGALPAWALTPPAQLDRTTLLKRPATGSATTPGTEALPVHPLPLERLRMPAALSGRDGRFRAPRAALALAADDDWQALQAWLALRTPGSATWRAYRKEAERLLLWAWWVAGKPLSSLDADDLAAYTRFLAAPAAGWTAPRGTPRWHDDWRPFEGPLAERSRALALSVLRGLFGWWTAQGYLAVNGWALGGPAPVPAERIAQSAQQAVAPPRAARPGRAPTSGDGAPARRSPLPRALDLPTQQALRLWLQRGIAREGRTPAWLRLRAMLCLALDAGLRPAELVAARLAWVVWPGPAAVAGLATQEPASHEPGPWHAMTAAPAALRIPDQPGCVPREVVLGAEAAAALGEYLASRRAPTAARGTAGEVPLLAHLRAETPLSPARLYELVTVALRAGADALRETQPVAAAALGRASAMWLRQGSGLRSAAQGVSGAELQQQMGHRSRASTAAYRRLARGLAAEASTA